MKILINSAYILLIFNYAIDHPYKSFLNYFLTFLLMGLILLILLKRKNKFVVPVEVILLSIFLFSSIFFGGVIAIDKVVFVEKFLTVFQGFLIFVISIIVVQINHSERMNFLAISLIPLVLLIVSYNTLGTNLFNISYISEERLVNGGLNPNIFSHILVISLISIFYSINLNKKHFYLIFLIPVGIFLVAISGSRNGLIGLGITLVLLLLFFIIPFIQKKYGLFKGLVINSLISVSAITFLYKVYSFISLNFVVGERLDYLNDFSSGSMYIRLLLYKESLSVFMQNPLIGIGLDQYRLISITGKYTHSDYMEILTSTGILGFILYMSIYIILIVKIVFEVKRGNLEFKFGAILTVFIISMLYFGLGRPWYDQNIRWFVLGSISGTLIITKINSLKRINI